MNKDEVKDFIAEVLDDTLENINFKMSMETDYSFEEIADIVDEVWEEVVHERSKK